MPNLPKAKTSFLTIPQVVNKAKERGFVFGFGDPYNRIRYYIKIGLLPNMARKSVDGQPAEGHLPESVVDRLLRIQNLKDQGLDYNQILQKIDEPVVLVEEKILPVIEEKNVAPPLPSLLPAKIPTWPKKRLGFKLSRPFLVTLSLLLPVIITILGLTFLEKKLPTTKFLPFSIKLLGNTRSSSPPGIIHQSSEQVLADTISKNASFNINLPTNINSSASIAGNLVVRGETDFFAAVRTNNNNISMGTGAVISGFWQGSPVITKYGGTGNDWSNIAQGGLPYFSGLGIMAALPAGNSGQVLVTEGSSANPKWTNLGSQLKAGKNITISSDATPSIATVDNPKFDTSVTTPLIDTGGNLGIGTTNQTGLTLGRTGAPTIINGSANTVNGNTTFTNNATVSGTLGATEVAVGTTAPVASALLEMVSTSRGFLAPRMTQAQRDAISSPATGLLIYNTISNQYNVYNGTDWSSVGGTASQWQLNSGVISPFDTTQSVAIGGTATSSASLFFNGVLGTISNPSNGGGILNIPGSVAFDDLVAIVGTSSSYPVLTVRGNSTQSSASISGTNANATLVVDNNAVGDVFTASTSGRTRLVVDKNGNVGVGTSAPGAVLDVTGGIRGSSNLTLTSTSNQIIFSSGTPGTLSWNPSSTRTVTIPNDNVSNANICLSTGNCTGQPGSGIGGSGTLNYLAKFTPDGNNIGNSLLFDNGSGVALGTTTPVGLFLTTGKFTGKANTIHNETGDQAVFTASISGTTKFVINNTGQLGLGAGANNNTLLADVDLRTLTNTVPVASIAGSTGVAALIVDNNKLVGGRPGDLFTASSAGMTRFVIAGDGNVGIGTTQPGAALDVVGTGRISSSLSLSSTSNQLIFGSGTTGTLTWTPASSSKTITLPNANGTIAVSASSPITLSALGDVGCSTCLTAGSGGTFAITLAGTSGSNQTINQGDTMTIAAGNNITTTGAATDSVTVATVNNPNFTTSVQTPTLREKFAKAFAPDQFTVSK